VVGGVAGLTARQNRRRPEDVWWDEPTISYADARTAQCPTCHARPGASCVTVGVPRRGARMELHHRARYAEARRLAGAAELDSE
jgi:hypothetical protein